jgi:hypothetical protein
MNISEIKYRAQCKGYSKVLSLQSDFQRAERDLKLGLTGGVSIEEIEAIRNGIATEITVWNYIFKLIENDNK